MHMTTTVLNRLYRLKDYALAVMAGLTGSFAFAPYNLSYLSFIALFVLFWFLYGKQCQARKSWVLLTSWSFFTIFWIHVSMTHYSDVPMVVAVIVLLIFSAYLTGYHALVIYLANRIFCGQMFLKNVLAVPAGFVIADYLTGHVLTGFPWFYLGYSQTDTFLNSLAPIAGVHSITLCMLVVTALFFHAAHSRKLWYAATSLIILTITANLNLEFTEPLEKKSVALVQGNIAQQIKWDPSQAGNIFETYIKLSKPYLNGEKHTDILVWPESAVPDLENYTANVLNHLDLLTKKYQTSFITGIQTYHPGDETYYNAVIGLGIIDSEGKIPYRYQDGNRYYKRHLVPFGEKVPFEETLRKYGSFFNMPMSSFSNGSEVQENIRASDLKIATAICYEIAYPDEMLVNIHPDTSMILTVSNDGWFGTYDLKTGKYYVSAGPYQHAEIARMRALEFQKPVLRATNNGITSIIAHDGTALNLPLYHEGVLTGTIIPRTGSTPFETYGFTIVFSIVWAMLLVAFSSLLILMITTKRKIRKTSVN